MSKSRVTISIDNELASYLRSQPNASAVVAEAVKAYQARELRRELEQAYREDADDAERLNSEWQSTDAELSE